MNNPVMYPNSVYNPITNFPVSYATSNL